MKIKKLELRSGNKGIKALIHTPHIRKTIISIFIGAIAGFGFFYFTEGRLMDSILFQDAIKSVLIGGFFGFFITNSPCARNRC